MTMEVAVEDVKDILGVNTQFKNKVFRATDFGLPPNIKRQNSLAVNSSHNNKTTENTKEFAKKEQLNTQKTNHTPNAESKTSPITISITKPENRTVNSSKNYVRVEATAQSHNGEPIIDMWIRLNENDLDYKKRGIDIAQKDYKSINGTHAKIGVNVYLKGPKNHIPVLASTDSSIFISEIINVTGQKADDIYKPNLYIMSVGVSVYKTSKELNLKNGV